MGTRLSAALTLVVPGDVVRPTGGNVWDRAVARALRDGGTEVGWCPVPGRWPVPVEGPDALDAALAGLPDGSAVLVDGLLLCGWPDVAGRHARRLRLSVVVHLPLSLETGLAPGAAARLAAAEAEVLRAAAASGRVVTTSRWCAEQVREAARLPPEAVVVAHPGTCPPPPRARVRAGADPALDAAPEGDGTRLLAVGALTPRKGHDVLLAALARTDPRGWRLDVVGPDPREEPTCPPALARHVAHLRAAAAALRRDGADVRLHGAAVGAGLERHWRRADLLVVPSRAETYGMVVGEALVRGVPCLVSTAGGLPEALGAAPGPDGGPPGLLVPPDDPAALATALRRWREDGGLRQRSRALAARRGEELRRHGWDACADVLRRALLGAA